MLAWENAVAVPLRMRAQWSSSVVVKNDRMPMLLVAWVGGWGGG